MLYMAGSLPSGHIVAIVGSRRVSTYGRRIATSIAASLARHGVTIISGLAFGVDSLAHKAALDAGGKTVAVLPSGLHPNVLSPRSNLALAHRILKEGALISEYAPDVSARKEHYHARNRLISGLAEALIVVEAALPSGSMITARHAMEQGREVWAVPGNIDSDVSAGTNHLITEGAHPLVKVDYFLESLGIKGSVQQIQHDALRHITSEPRHIDAVAEETDCDPSTLQAELTKQELLGAVTHVGGGYYVTCQ